MKWNEEELLFRAIYRDADKLMAVYPLKRLSSSAKVLQRPRCVYTVKAYTAVHVSPQAFSVCLSVPQPLWPTQHLGNHIPLLLSSTFAGQILLNLRIRYNSHMSQWISTKSGQRGADTQKGIFVHKDCRVAVGFPTAWCKGTKVKY